MASVVCSDALDVLLLDGVTGGTQGGGHALLCLGCLCRSLGWLSLSVGGGGAQCCECGGFGCGVFLDRLW